MGARISIFAMAQMHRKDKTGRVPILIRIDLGSKPVAYDKPGDTTHKVLPEHWDADKRLIKDEHPNARIINTIIKQRIAELEGMFLKKELDGQVLTKYAIKLMLKGNDASQCFYIFCRQQIKDKYDNAETIRTYTTEVTKLQQFRTELPFADINFQFLQSYAAWMRDVKGNKPNTIWKTFKFMNTMLNDAIKIGGIIKVNPFDKFDRGVYKQTVRTFLSATERQRLEGLLKRPMPHDLFQVTAYFLFMCYCGLRFRDAMAFRYEDHIIDDQRLFMVTEKADEPVNIKLYPKLREIILYVREHPLKMTNQEFNDRLKLIATLAEISKTLTAHVGRHTFGRLLAENNIDKSRAQKLLGHRDKRATDVYYHVQDTDLDNEIDAKLQSVK